MDVGILSNLLILWTMSRKFPIEKGYAKCLEVVSEIAEGSTMVFIRHGNAIGEKTVVPRLEEDIANVYVEQVFKPKYKGGHDPQASLLRNIEMCKTDPVPDLCLAWFAGKKSGDALHTANQARKYGIHAAGLQLLQYITILLYLILIIIHHGLLGMCILGQEIVYY